MKTTLNMPHLRVCMESRLYCSTHQASHHNSDYNPCRDRILCRVLRGRHTCCAKCLIKVTGRNQFQGQRVLELALKRGFIMGMEHVKQRVSFDLKTLGSSTWGAFFIIYKQDLPNHWKTVLTCPQDPFRERTSRVRCKCILILLLMITIFIVSPVAIGLGIAAAKRNKGSSAGDENSISQDIPSSGEVGGNTDSSQSLTFGDWFCSDCRCYQDDAALKKCLESLNA